MAAYGFVAPPADKSAPALAVGVWMGNSDSTPNDGKLSLDTSAPLWSSILTEVSKGEKIAKFKAPSKGLVTATVDAFTGLKPGPFSKRTVSEYFLPGTVPTQRETSRVAATVDSATGLLWRERPAQGPKVTKGFFNLSEVESNFPNWQKANANWGARAARGSGVGGGPKGIRTSYFYTGAFTPFGRTWAHRSHRPSSARSTHRQSSAIRSRHGLRRAAGSRRACRPTRVAASPPTIPTSHRSRSRPKH